jgi:hypothetical protein
MVKKVVIEKQEEEIELDNYFRPPLFVGVNKVFTADQDMAFDFATYYDGYPKSLVLSTEDKSRVVDIINGSNIKLGMDLGLKLVNSDIYTSDGRYFASIRGWGRLTGGMGIKSSTAIDIQDMFAEKIIRLINDAK